MRLLYFFVSSSLLIGMVLLIRKLFRKKLAPGVLYALWLIPAIRLLLPFVSWELPTFGTMADILNSPYALVSELQEARALSKGEMITDIEEETSQVQNPPNEPTGTKIYDAVVSDASDNLGEKNRTEKELLQENNE